MYICIYIYIYMCVYNQYTPVYVRCAGLGPGRRSGAALGRASAGDCDSAREEAWPKSLVFRGEGFKFRVWEFRMLNIEG